MNFIKTALSYLPSKLPVGMTEFEAFTGDIIALSGKYADEDSLKFAISTMILHADAHHAYIPKQYFVRRLRKVAANQVASAAMTDIKYKQAEAQALALKQAEEAANQKADNETVPEAN